MLALICHSLRPNVLVSPDALVVSLAARKTYTNIVPTYLSTVRKKTANKKTLKQNKRAELSVRSINIGAAENY